MEAVTQKLKAVHEIEQYFQKTNITPDEVNDYLTGVETVPIQQKVKIVNLLLRPQVNLSPLTEAVPAIQERLAGYKAEYLEMAEINLKYEGYIRKEQDLVLKTTKLEDYKLSDEIDYKAITSLSLEAREKLHKMKPATIGQASRISGVSPADVSVLLIHLGRI